MQPLRRRGVGCSILVVVRDARDREKQSEMLPDVIAVRGLDGIPIGLIPPTLYDFSSVDNDAMGLVQLAAVVEEEEVG